MPSKYVLEVMLDNDFPEDLKGHYINYKCNGQDSGVDLIIPNIMYPQVSKTTTLNHKISCQMCKYKEGKFVGYVSYWLLPRSSTSKTNYRMANSMGLIDSGYRGNIMAKIDTIPVFVNNENGELVSLDNENVIQKGTRLFQIAVGDLTPISEVKVVDSLTSTDRGSGGFGSTGL